MTNIVPQSSANNEKGWEKFESYCRTLVKDRGKELYVVAGPQGKGGESRGRSLQVIRSKDGDIVVPAVTWKVVMVLDQARPQAPTCDSLPSSCRTTKRSATTGPSTAVRPGRGKVDRLHLLRPRRSVRYRTPEGED